MTDPTRALEEKVAEAIADVVDRDGEWNMPRSVARVAARAAIRAHTEHLLSLAPNELMGADLPPTPWRTERGGYWYDFVAADGEKLAEYEGECELAGGIVHRVNTHPTILAALVAARAEWARLLRKFAAVILARHTASAAGEEVCDGETGELCEVALLARAQLAAAQAELSQRRLTEIADGIAELQQVDRELLAKKERAESDLAAARAEVERFAVERAAWLTSAVLLGREVACEMVYRGRSQLRRADAAEHPNKVLRTRLVPPPYVAQYVTRELQSLPSAELRQLAARVVDEWEHEPAAKEE